MSLVFDTGGEVWALKREKIKFDNQVTEVLRYKNGAFISYTGDKGFPIENPGSLLSTTIDSRGVIWCRMNDGIYRFDGIFWKKYTESDGLASNTIYTLATDGKGQTWAGTDNGVSRFEESYAVFVAQEKNNLSPEFKISGNFPNPFNPRTSIQFILPRAGKITLSVYNITGQKIRTLLSEFIPAGTHTAVWDGGDDMGRMVSSGIYLVCLKEENRLQTHRMLLMK